jgi:hypothetical protein
MRACQARAFDAHQTATLMAKFKKKLAEDEEEAGEEEAAHDVASRPSSNADSAAEVEKYIPKQILDRFEVHSYRHAAAILANSYPESLNELINALTKFELTTTEIGIPGGNESEMPKKFARLLRPKWVEARIQADLVVRQKCATEELHDGKLKKKKLPHAAPIVLENFIDGHKIDFVSGKVAFDFEWNSKDQTFDRDLYALRTFHECGLINVGVIVTRGNSMSPIFEKIPRRLKNGSFKLNDAGEKVSVKAKYGASTTWMGKLLYRLNAGRHGGCPVLAIGITPKVVTDWE